jgi:hypothetical protein
VKVKILGPLETLTNLLFQFTTLTLIFNCGVYPVGVSEEVVAAGTLVGNVAGTLVGEVARTISGLLASATS